jgi:PAS domain S-box-containing protein
MVSVLLAWWMVDRTVAQPAGGETGERRVLFLGNESLPPMSFMKNGKPTGIVIDLAKALAERIHHPVEIRLMNWAEAQQLVLEGRADALLQINPDPQRIKDYDFSDPLLASEFTIFTSVERPGVASMIDLRGFKVGVEDKGLPMLLLQKDPQITLKTVPDFVQGFRMLSEGALDAMVVDRWVGRYVLAENDIRGVRMFDEPFSRSYSAIAVKKGNTSLITDINAALADIRRDGTYDRIIKSWRSKEVVFKTREQLRQQAWLIAVISVALLATLAGVAVLVREIRRRKRVEATLRRSEERFRTLAAASFEGIAVTAGGRCVDANEQLASVLGYALSELIGREVSSMIAPEDRRRVMENIEAGRDSAIEHGMLRKDGSRCTVEARGRTLDHRGRQVRYTVIRDITERKRAEEAVRQNEAMLKTVLDQLPSGVTVRDANSGAIVLSNAKAQEIVGTLAGNFEQFSGYRAFHLDGCPYQTEEWPLHRCMATGEVIEAEEMEYERPDGTRISVTISAAPVRDSEGQIALIAGSFNDITARKQMEKELRKSRDELELRVRERTAELKTYMAKLEQSNQALQDFAYIAAHDMNEPLRKVISFGNVLRQKCGDSLEQSGNDYLNRMLNATERMQSLLKGLLEYSRVTTKVDPFVDVELAKIVGEVLSDLEIRVKRTGAEIRVLELPVVKADPTQMRQLLQNLIENALKFHKDGEKPVVEVRSSFADGRLQIMVDDNGIGFEEQYLERIFAPFQRLHGKNSQYEGMGMGLAISKKIVERHGGSITARSTPGQGATFIITLPLNQPH